MPLTAYMPTDPERYPKRKDSALFSQDLPAGQYVYVQDCAGQVWVLPDGHHHHPLVLGRGRPATAAGELRLGVKALVESVNNLSGTFRCHPDSLFTALGGLIRQGAVIAADAIEPFEA